MSQNPGFFNNFRRNFTFQHRPPTSYILPPPPLPPFIATHETSDEEFVKRLEDFIPAVRKRPLNKNKIWRMKVDVIRLLGALHDINVQEENLSYSLNLSDEEWQSTMKNLKVNRKVLKESIIRMSKTGLDCSRKLLVKRRAKRLRMKRLREEKKDEKKERIRQREEKSRKIDENLQKIKDDIRKAKEAEEAKFQADMVLKEVLRKKHDAKKNIVKLDALVKLRKARENTVKGKGLAVSETESKAFQQHIDRLKALWVHKLAAYEKEEAELRATLEKCDGVGDETEIQASNIVKWRKALFGGKDNPQVDFNGDMERFISVRAQWDQFIDEGPESTPIPVGWVCPDEKS